MNCKPGDLAIRVFAADTCTVPLGAIVKVVKFFRGTHKAYGSDGVLRTVHDVWSVEWQGKTFGVRGYLIGVPDSHLRPIRDPGDDAMDETLQWLPAPTIHSQIKEDKSQEVAYG